MGVFVTEAIGTGRPVEVSLDTGKVYIGQIVQSGIGMNIQFDLMIVPSLSGYRDRETNELIITHSYLQALMEKYRDWQDFKIAMSLSRIVLVRYFESRLYEKFSNQDEPDEWDLESITRKQQRVGFFARVRGGFPCMICRSYSCTLTRKFTRSRPPRPAVPMGSSRSHRSRPTATRDRPDVSVPGAWPAGRDRRPDGWHGPTPAGRPLPPCAPAPRGSRCRAKSMELPFRPCWLGARRERRVASHP